MISQVHATSWTAKSASGSTGTDEVALPPHAAQGLWTLIAIARPMGASSIERA
jgi:hypothetical protein